MTVRIPFDNTYARLPESFFARLDPTPVAAPRLLRLNTALAEHLGIDPVALGGPDGARILAGNLVPAGAEPIAMAYAGHQFGHFVPQLGDGRAILLGEVVDRDGARRDIQLKGSGPTPFSRRGDGRAALGPALREYLVSEAMAALGVPTTRALAVVATGESVVRETLLPGAVVTRVAASHLRVGTFQYFAARGDVASVRQLADYAIARHDPEAAAAEFPYRALLDGIVARQAGLVAGWLLLGFVHGVMNTDNCTISGETIDYGPCAFLDAYDPNAVFSSIDHAGRYAYGQQPRMVQWNLVRLAEALLPLLDAEEPASIAAAEASLATFAGHFEAAYVGGLRRKLGLATAQADDAALAQTLLRCMADAGADFTLVFRRLADAAATAANDTPVRALFADPRPFDDWARAWRQRLAAEPVDGVARAEAMRAANPAVIPRNQHVEAALAAAVAHDDLTEFDALHEALADPYSRAAEASRFAALPGGAAEPYRTFCGT